MKPVEAGCNCGQCPFKRTGSEGEPGQFILATIPPRVRGIVITDAPTKREGDDLQTFAGHIGDKWREALEHARLDGDTLAVAHALMCVPREPRRKDEVKAATAACSPQVQKLLALYPDVPVLTLGPAAMSAVGVKGALTGRKSIRGFLNGRFLHTYSLTFASFADPYSWGPFLVDVARFGRMIDGVLEEPPRTVNQGGVRELYELLRSAEGDEIAVDIETTPETPQEPWTGKDPTRALLKQIGFGTPDMGMSIFWEDASPDTKAAVKMVLAGDVTKVFHNGPWFDLRVLARYGMPVVNWEDTRDMRRAVSSTSRLSLNHLGSLATDIHAWKGGDDKFDEDSVPEGAVEDFSEESAIPEAQAPVAAWASEDREEAGKYNALDCAVTARVYDMCRRDMKSETKAGAKSAELYEIHKKLSLITAEMHTTGIYVNRDWRNFMLSCLEQSVVEKRELVRVAVGDENFPVTANGMRSLIYKRHAKTGIKCFHVPDPSDKRMWTNELQETIAVNENSLLMLLVSGMAPDELVPIIEAWWTYQGELKRLGYVKSALLDHATGPDGRLRPGWNSCGTDTGRFACSQPNVMNLEQLLRVMFGPAPGNVMVHADKASLEVRVMQQVTGDKNLMAGINLGSVYSFDAHEWFNVPRDIDPKTQKKGIYKACKIIHLGKQYGAGNKTVWQQALRQDRRFTWNQVVVLSKQFEKTYSGVVQYWSDEMERVQGCGFSESRLLGRRRYYPSEPELSETVNYPVQSTASDLMNLEMIELHERLRKEVPSARIVFQLHDAVDVEAPEADVAKVERVVREVMSRDWSFCGRTASYPVDMKTAYFSKGETWQDL